MSAISRTALLNKWIRVKQIENILDSDNKIFTDRANLKIELKQLLEQIRIEGKILEERRILREQGV